MSQCSCTKDKEVTCIVHPTPKAMKQRIGNLEAELAALRKAAIRYVLRETDRVADEGKSVLLEIRVKPDGSIEGK